MRWILSAVWLFVAASVACAGELRVGAASVVISPALGTPLAGYYEPRAASGVHDDLRAQAIIFEQDGSKAAMVVCDLISMPRSVVVEARKLIQQQTGLSPERVMISATHTHTGPVLPVGSSISPADGADMEAARQYVQSLPQLIARAVKEASDRLAPAKVSVGDGHEDQVSHNRRYFMKDGSVGWNPGKLNPNIVKPAGPIDPQIPVAYFESPEGNPIATYVNFAMHPDTTGGTLISADYPNTLRMLLGRIKGPDMVTVFSNGCCGNINHIDVSTRERQQGPQEAARIGTILAGDVLKAYAGLQPVASFAPRARSQIVELDLPKITPDDVEQARKIAVKFGKSRPTFLQRVNAFKVLDVAARQGKPQEVEVQVIALGDDLAFVALPGEIFVELGLQIKKQSPFKHTIIAELADGAIGYIPTERAFREGNYEPTSARCAPGSGEKLVDVALKMLNEVKQ